MTVIELLLPAALAAGFVGSGHCVGMCGAVVALLERPGGGAWPQRLAYNTGRLGFYVLLGVIGGAIGTVLTRLPGIGEGLLVLRVLAAVLVIALAVNLLFDVASLRFLEQAGAGLWRRLSPLARRVLPATTLPRALAAGFVWGALPCGLVYSAVAMAAATGTAAGGAAVMAAFWAGTLPALLVTGTLAGRLPRRPGLRRLSGALLLLAGLAALALPFLHPSDTPHDHHSGASTTAT